ncbi:phosphorylcholine transferase LicD [Enterococcus casseliflavus]|uniref:LicD family protein n=1 Tax=Enterococcus TaxID=1350 RepID=UPI0028A2067D|nr:LicD family protein [Enterococcus sp.]
MSDLQKKLLNMMKDFHEFCENNNIKYYVIGGTFLGAVRHKGFIPWDDDIDIIIPRSDYNRLKSLEHKLPKNLELMTKGFKNEKGTFAYQKLVDRNTTLVENINEKRILGIYIDIFPLDGAGKTFLGSKLRYYWIKSLVYVLWFNGNTQHNNKGLKSLIIKLSKIFDNRKIYEFISSQLEKVDWIESRYSGNFMGAYGFTEIIPTEIYGRPTLYKFEDTFFYGPENFHEFLKHIYGDKYGELPPIERRVSHHEYEYINIHQPFDEYYKSQN